MDKPAVALVKDLKSRGLLDSTIVAWGGEMGHSPAAQRRISTATCLPLNIPASCIEAHQSDRTVSG